ncbi:hypothetical protein BDF21DRAFT_428380 [Thamnidium elegans]|nr:hypothetical protein BDF21DRAFT_428380 [Thamnidium elegans]
MSEQYRKNIERKAEASTAMLRSNQKLLDKHMSFCPKNIVKVYDKRQLEWNDVKLMPQSTQENWLLMKGQLIFWKIMS